MAMKKASIELNIQKYLGTDAGPARWLPPFLILIATFTAFSPTLHNGFLDWDDDRNFLENPNYRGLGWTQLRWMFTTFHMGHYQPLSWVTLGLDYLLWGMEPFGYHLTNLLLHMANALLFYFISLRLLSLGRFAFPETGRLVFRAAAGFAALVFAIHPLRVESVAWATERRDVLSGLFFLATILCYLRAATDVVTDCRRRRWMALAVILYSLSLLSKVSGVVLPIILLVLDVYPLGRLEADPRAWFSAAARRVWREKIPFLLLALGATVMALVAQYQAGTIQPYQQYGVVPRLAQALFGLAFYLWKTALPLGLSPLYEMPKQPIAQDWLFILSGAAVLAVSGALFIFRRRWPAALVSWVCYMLILAPVSGIAQNGPQIAADRYSYLSCLGWAILAGSALILCWQFWLNSRMGRQILVLVSGLAVAILLTLGILTWKQTQVWRNSETLWRHVLAVTQNSRFELSYAHLHLGNILAGQGKLDEAIEHYRQVLQIVPMFVIAHYNLGILLAKQGKLDEAMEHYRQVLQLHPSDAKAHYNLGNALAIRGELEEAMKHYRQALQIEPLYLEARHNLGVALSLQGKNDEAAIHYQESLRIMKARPEASSSR